VIGKVLRGERVAGLIYYLYSPGRHEEHTDPHIVAGWRHPAELEPPLRPGGRRDFRHLNGLLQQTVAALGDRAPNRPVWHCVARAAPTDRMLSDAEWAQVAAEIMHRTGLAPRGKEDDAVRWVTIRHAADHIHIVATLARQDGTRPRVSNDYYRVREACLAAEQRFGLRRTAPGDRTAACRPTRAETEKAQRHGWPEPPRVALKRAVSAAAAAAASEAEFFDHLQQSGVLVRKRSSTRNPGEVTGYAVALVQDQTSHGGPVWYSGGKLAADLTLPKLRHRWTDNPLNSPATPTDALTAAERSAIWEHTARAAANAAEEIRRLTVTGDRAAAADAAGAAADTLHAAASVLGSRVIREAANTYDRAARTPYGRIPRRTRTGTGLRRAARLLSAAGYAGQDQSLVQAALVPRLAALTEAVAELRLAQRHPAQAGAARSAADHLGPGLRTSPGVTVQHSEKSRSASSMSREAFPQPPHPSPCRPSAARSRTAPRPGTPHQAGPPRRRGPSR
jgi:hypothetical protein